MKRGGWRVDDCETECVCEVESGLLMKAECLEGGIEGASWSWNVENQVATF